MVTWREMAGEVLADEAAETGWSEAKPCEVKDERRELAGVEKAESEPVWLSLRRLLSEVLRLNTLRKSRWSEEDECDPEDADADAAAECEVPVMGAATSSESCVRVCSMAWPCTSARRRECEWEREAVWWCEELAWL